MKNKLRVGLSLLIALAFIVPVGSIMAEPSEEVVVSPEAGTTITREKHYSNGMQAPGDITSNGITFVNQDDEEVPVLSWETIPMADYYTILGGLNIEPLGQEETAEVQAGISLYSVTSGTEVIMYETDFEDNFDIYNNWVQIDEDCGYDGYFDSFSWSDARSVSADHSMKNTMYEIYKGNQDDYLMNVNCFDTSDQFALNVQFDVWVEGQYDWDGGAPLIDFFYDYLDFQIYDDGLWYSAPLYIYDAETMTWTYYGVLEPFVDTTFPLNWEARWGWNVTPWISELGGGWWHVDLDVPTWWFIDPDCAMFRFHWHSDPQFQYEGAYVDNFKVISIEDVETKIWQTHLQECTEVPVGVPTTVEFPLDWQDVVPGTYKIKYWVESQNCQSGYNDLFMKGNDVEIYFKVGDEIDCAIENLWIEDSFTHIIVPDDGDMTQGADAHIVFDYCNYGNVPIVDMPINLIIQKKIWNREFDYDCESALQITSSTGEVQLSDFKSVDGKAIEFSNEDYHRYEQSCWYYVEFGKTLDFHAEHVILEAKWAALTDADDFWGDYPYGDFAIPVLFDSYSNSILGSGYARTTNPDVCMVGFNPDFTNTLHMDLKEIYDYYYDNYGYFKDAYGNKVYEATFGFSFTEYDEDGINYNEFADSIGIMESGVWIDDVTVDVLELSDPVFEDTMIIPGPIEPGECDTAQFEWEDVPYSHYKITVESDCELDIDMDNNMQSQQIRVVDPLEMADDKNMESIDFTEDCNGAWGICTSDWDNYLSTNPDSNTYPAWANNVAVLAPEHEDCEPDSFTLDISDLDPLTDDLDLIFNAWWELEGGWDFVYLEISDNPEPTEIGDWMTIASFTGTSYSDPSADPDGFVVVTIDLWPYMVDDDFCLRFRLESDMGTQYRGMNIDWLTITNLFWEVDDEITFDDMDTMENWCVDCVHYGDFWSTGPCWEVDPIPLLPIENALVWETEIADAYQAWLNVDIDYDLLDIQYSLYLFWAGQYIDVRHTYVADLEVSADGGATWTVLERFSGAGSAGSYDLTPYAGNELIVRLTLKYVGYITNPNLMDGYIGGIPEYYLMNGDLPLYFGIFDGGYIEVCEMSISGKKDTTAPTSTITMSGTMADSGWYTTPVSVKITATDDAAMGEIHYILDGQETVVQGDTASFTVSGNGEHNIAYWAVDAVGNVEAQHVVPTFRIDAGSPPTVSIVAPEPGLYLFGNKLLSLSKVFIIGAFTVEATASDADSSVYRVQFLLDGDVVAEDTEAPYSAYVAEKHMGAGTLKAIAEDFAGNTAEDTLDITYYKFL